MLTPYLVVLRLPPATARLHLAPTPSIPTAAGTTPVAAIAALAHHGGQGAKLWLERGLKDPEACVRVHTVAQLEHAAPALHRELFEDTYRRFAEALGAKPEPELLRWCCEQQRERALENFELRPDCVETIETLRGAGLHVSIVSNIDDDYLDPMVERAGPSARGRGSFARG